MEKTTIADDEMKVFAHFFALQSFAVSLIAIGHPDDRFTLFNYQVSIGL